MEGRKMKEQKKQEKYRIIATRGSRDIEYEVLVKVKNDDFDIGWVNGKLTRIDWAGEACSLSRMAGCKFISIAKNGYKI